MRSPSLPRSLALALLAFPVAGCTEKAVGSTDDSAAPAIPVSDVTASVHETIASIVVVTWTQDAPGEVYLRFRVAGEEWRTSPVLRREAGAQSELLLGLPYDSALEFEVVVDGVVGPENNTTNGPLPVDAIVPDLVVTDPTLWAPEDGYLLTSMNATGEGWDEGTFWLFIVDRQGRVVWAYEIPDRHWCLEPQLSRDGTALIWDELTFWTLREREDGQVHRMTIDGTFEQSWVVPGANHPFGLAWWSFDYPSALWVQDAAGAAEKFWDCSEVQALTGDNTNCLINTTFWNEPTNTFLISNASSHWVAEVDAENAEILRLFGPVNNAWSFDPPDSAFYMNHSVNYTEAGTLLLSAWLDGAVEVGVAREYALDETTNTLTQVWSSGETAGIPTQFGGTARRLANGNTLHAFGTNPRVQEVTADGQIAWDLDWPEEHLLGGTSFLTDLYALRR